MVENLPQRKAIRLENYNYSDAGYYFITICTKDRKQILSEINEQNVGATIGRPQIKLKYTGEIAKKYIDNIENVYKNIKIDEYIIMPNHIHIIIIIEKNEGQNILKIIQQLKGVITKKAGYHLWQKSFYEHVIRNEKEYYTIKEYVKNNPINWAEDKYY